MKHIIWKILNTLAGILTQWLRRYRQWLLWITYHLSGYNTRDEQWNLCFFNVGSQCIFLVYDFKRIRILWSHWWISSNNKLQMVVVSHNILCGVDTLLKEKKVKKCLFYPIPSPTAISPEQSVCLSLLRQVLAENQVPCDSYENILCDSLKGHTFLNAANLSALGDLLLFFYKCKQLFIQSGNKDIREHMSFFSNYCDSYNLGQPLRGKLGWLEGAKICRQIVGRCLFFYFFFTYILVIPPSYFWFKILCSISLGLLIGRYFSLLRRSLLLLRYRFGKRRIHLPGKPFSRKFLHKKYLLADLLEYPIFMLQKSYNVKYQGRCRDFLRACRLFYDKMAPTGKDQPREKATEDQTVQDPPCPVSKKENCD